MCVIKYEIYFNTVYYSNGDSLLLVFIFIFNNYAYSTIQLKNSKRFATKTK